MRSLLLLKKSSYTLGWALKHTPFFPKMSIPVRSKLGPFLLSYLVIFMNGGLLALFGSMIGPTATEGRTIRTALDSQAAMRGSGKGGRINTWVPGHRALYKEAGITKQQTKAGSTRYNQQTPVQEHQARAEGTSITHRKPPVELGFDGLDVAHASREVCWQQPVR